MSSYVSLLRDNYDYRHLWWGAVVSQLGDWFNLIASAALIANLTDSGTAISYLFLARFIPLFLFSPIAGVLADRYDRRAILIASDLLRAVTVLGFLLVRRPDQIWLLYLLTVLQFALSSLFTPARSAVIANLVAPANLVTANALDSLTWSTMLAFGALLGGLAAAAFGIATAFILDALTFLLSAWFISRIKKPIQSEAAEAPPSLFPSQPPNQNRPAKSGVSPPGWLDFRNGLRYLRGEPFILAISLVKGAGSLAWGAINVLEITYAEKFFSNAGASARTLGIIYAATGLGTGLGPLLLRRWLGDAPVRMRWAIVAGFALLAAGIVWLSLAPTLAWYTAGTFLRAVGSGTIWVFSAALLQTIVPDRFRGRVFAFEFAFLTLTQSISVFWAGFAQDQLGLPVRTVTGFMSLVAVAAGLFWLTIHLRNVKG